MQVSILKLISSKNYFFLTQKFSTKTFKIDDILKAAIQDAGLEFFNTSGTYSSPSSNSSESSLANLGGLDDDFNLTDLDWNLLDQSEADSPPASISSCSISQSPPLITTTTTNQIHTHNNPTFGDNIDQEDTDPFILALQELDDKNNLYKDCHQDTSFYDNTSNISNISNKIVDANLRPQVLPAPPKIVSLTSQNSFSQQTSTGTTGNGKSSDLLSLINYRASTVVNNQKANSQVFEIFKFNRGWKTKLWCIKHKQPENQQTNLKISNNSCNVKQKVYI